MSDIAKKLLAKVIKMMTKAKMTTQMKLAVACDIEPGQLSKFIKYSGPLAAEKQEFLVGELERIVVEVDEVPFDREETRKTLAKILSEIRIGTPVFQLHPQMEVSGVGSIDPEQITWLRNTAQKLMKMGFKVFLHLDVHIEVQSPELNTGKEKV